MSLHLLMPLAEQAIINGLIDRKAPLMRKNKFGLCLMVLSGLVLLSALFFFTLAGYGWLLTEFSQPEAAFYTGLALMLACALMALGGYSSLKKKPKAALAVEKDAMDFVQTLATTVSNDLAEPIQENPKTAMLLAATAGFLAGERL